MSDEWRGQKEKSNRPMLMLMRWIALRLGRTFSRIFISIICFYYLLFSIVGRRESKRYLTRVLDRKPTLIDVFKHYYTYASVILDRVYIFSNRLDLLDIHIHGVDIMHEQQQRQGGSLFFGSHLGSFELLRVVGIHGHELPIRVLMHPDAGEKITGYLHAMAPDIAKSVIEVGKPDTLLKVNDALNDGNIVGVLADRVYQEDKSVQAQFLGKPVNLPMGPMLIAGLCQVPVVMCFGLYRGGNRYDVYFEKLTDGLEIKREQREQMIAEWMQKYISRVEYYAKQYPYNWFNLYDYWKI